MVEGLSYDQLAEAYLSLAERSSKQDLMLQEFIRTIEPLEAKVSSLEQAKDKDASEVFYYKSRWRS